MLSLLALFACKDPIPRTNVDDSGDTETQVEAPAYLEGIECEPVVIDSDDDPASGDCILSQAVKGGMQVMINAECTDPAITALGSKRHLVMVPDESGTLLWLHLGGSGGKPSNTTKLGSAAIDSGYRYISLAYTNEPSIADRCNCEDGPRPVACEELARTEVLTGEDASPWLVMEPDESIEYRLKALLQFLNQQNTKGGWDEFLTAEGEIKWSRIAVSGFSQGGGMAGLIARDHAVNRALYFSKGAGSALEAMVDPSAYQSCTTDEECGDWKCCPFEDLNCKAPPAEGGLCAGQVPQPWANTGPDTNGDSLGDANATKRTTPAERQFAVVHREETAWIYSPEVFETWGMGSDYIDLDTQQSGFSIDKQLFSLSLPPNNDCSEHQSMGADSCHSIHPDTGQPALLPVWRFVMDMDLD